MVRMGVEGVVEALWAALLGKLNDLVRKDVVVAVEPSLTVGTYAFSLSRLPIAYLLAGHRRASQGLPLNGQRHAER